MSAITGRTIINQASTLLQDANNTRWPLTELLDWLNDGQNALVGFRPDASAANLTAALVPGTKQAIPSPGMTVIDIVCNTDSTGTVAGQAVREAKREALDLWVPDWHTGVTVPANALVTHFIYDGRDPHTFYVYPPQPAAGTGYLRVVCSVIPPAVTLDAVNGAIVDSVIGVDDIYANALLNYVLYRAYQKDNETVDPALSERFHQAFVQAITVKTETDQAVEPKPKAGAHAPNPYGNG